MAIIQVEVKDEFVVGIAKSLGFSYPPENVPPFEEHVAAIQSYFDGVIDPFYKVLINEDPEVIAKQEELDTLILQKLGEAKI